MSQRVGRAKGYLVETGPFGSVESETFTCSHCNNVGTVKNRQDGQLLGVTCHACFSVICPNCARIGKCEPFEKKLEAIERRARLRASV
jgi:hypothetical protein